MIAGVHTYQSGPPELIVTGGNAFWPYVAEKSFMNRPNVIPGVSKKSAALVNGTWDTNGVGAAGSRLNQAAWCDPSLPTGVVSGDTVVRNSLACPGPLNLGLTPANYVLGNAPRSDGGARRPGYLNEDISIIKRTAITERVNIEFRADFLNIFNRTLFSWDQGGDQYGSIIQGTSVDSGPSGFGHIVGQGNFPREIQFGLKINY